MDHNKENYQLSVTLIGIHQQFEDITVLLRKKTLSTKTLFQLIVQAGLILYNTVSRCDSSLFKHHYRTFKRLLHNFNCSICHFEIRYKQMRDRALLEDKLNQQLVNFVTFQAKFEQYVKDQRILAKNPTMRDLLFD